MHWLFLKMNEIEAKNIGSAKTYQTRRFNIDI